MIFSDIHAILAQHLLVLMAQATDPELTSLSASEQNNITALIDNMATNALTGAVTGQRRPQMPILKPAVLTTFAPEWSMVSNMTTLKSVN